MWLKLGLGFWMLFSMHAVAAETLLSAAKLRQTALHYERGMDRTQDYRKAFRLYCLAAALEDRRAMHRLGWMYFNGRGVPRNLATAMGWFRRAAIRGDRYARRMVKKFNRIRPRHDSRCPVTHDPNKMTHNRIHTLAHVVGTELGVDPKLVMAVIKTESNFNPSARSPKFAYGLMQLMPATARRFSVNRLSPVENMIGGTLYLRWLLRHFNGDVSLAVAAYNAGERAVHRHRGIPPYKETRHYVHKILTEYRHTRHPIPKSLSF